MINAILLGLLNFFSSLISVFLSPLDNIIYNLLPDFNELIVNFNLFLARILEVIPWALSWFHIPSYLLNFIVLYYIFKVSITFVANRLKLILSWWHRLVP